jgi:hypothetical protein
MYSVYKIFVLKRRCCATYYTYIYTRVYISSEAHSSTGAAHFPAMHALSWRGMSLVSRALIPKITPSGILSLRGAKTAAPKKRTTPSSGRSKNDKGTNRNNRKKDIDPVERRMTAFYKNYSSIQKTKVPAKTKVPKPKPEIKPDIDVIRTRTPSVFICPPLDPDLVDYSQWEKRAEYLFSLSKEYVHPSTINYELPTDERPEFAFIGRSNVGKSSLIGALLGNEGLVKVSKEPGVSI